jgi:RimJ/RimL family protein N-acetyltransferase
VPSAPSPLRVPPLPELGAPGIRLRTWRPSDAERVYAICQDPLIQRWTTVPSPYTDGDAATFVADPGPIAWAVCDASSDDLIASIALRPSPDAPARAEIGYWCAPHARGRGVTASAGRLACTWAFEALALHRIEWFAEVGNEASWRTAHQIGIAYEGRIRRRLVGRRDQVVDAWSGSVLPGEVAAGPVPLPWGPDPVLTDGATTVRRWRADDAADFARLQGDPDILAWNGRPPDTTTSRRDAHTYLEQTLAEYWMTGTSAYFAIDHDGRVAGGVTIARRHQRLAEIGWWLGAEFRGRGTATQGVGLVARWARGVGLERLEARVHVDNPRSQRVAERVGMQREGHLVAEAPYARANPLRGMAPGGALAAASTVTTWGDAYLYGLLSGDLR